MTAAMTAMAMALTLFAAGARADEQNSNPLLTFYAVEMKREPQVTLKEFRNYARSHGQANFVVSKSPFVSYEGDGDVIIASYEPTRDAAQKLAEEIPTKGQVLELRLSPSAVSEKKGVAVYKLPLMMTEDAWMGDIWVRAGANPAQRIEKNVVISSTNPNIANLFKFVGYPDKETGVAYCLDECSRLDLVTGNRTPLTATKGEDAAGIRRSIDNLLTKEDAEACKNTMADQILNVDKEGYYRGVCPSKGNQVLQVQLKKDSGRWKIINSSWQAPLTIKK
jgi:hypothetical protein